MFNIGLTEIVLVFLVAFLVVGPKDLPKVVRFLAQMLKKLKVLIREFKKETGLDEMLKDVQETKQAVQSTLKEADVITPLKTAVSDVQSELKASEEPLSNIQHSINKGEQ